MLGNLGVGPIRPVVPVGGGVGPVGVGNGGGGVGPVVPVGPVGGGSGVGGGGGVGPVGGGVGGGIGGGVGGGGSTFGLLNRAYLNPWANRGGAGAAGQQMGGFGSLSGGVQDMLGAGGAGGGNMGGFQAPNYGQQAYQQRLQLQQGLPSQQPNQAPGPNGDQTANAWQPDTSKFYQWSDQLDDWQEMPQRGVLQAGDNPLWYYAESGPDTGPGWTFMEAPGIRDATQWSYNPSIVIDHLRGPGR